MSYKYYFHSAPEFKHVKTRCGKEITQPWNCANPAPQLARLEMELYLIMRVDKVEHPVQFLKRTVLDGTFKTFYGALAVLYVKQFIDG